MWVNRRAYRIYVPLDGAVLVMKTVAVAQILCALIQNWAFDSSAAHMHRKHFPLAMMNHL